jgi:hypothetical protein
MSCYLLTTRNSTSKPVSTSSPPFMAVWMVWSILSLSFWEASHLAPRLDIFLRLVSPCLLETVWVWVLVIICQPRPRRSSSNVRRRGNYGKSNISWPIRRRKSKRFTWRKVTQNSNPSASPTCILRTTKPLLTS